MKFGMLVPAFAMLAAMYGAAAAAEFPFDQELLLDAKPLAGSKRVPILTIGANGKAEVDFWCRSGPALVEVSGETFTFTPLAMRDEGCTAERSARDRELIEALSRVTQWRLEDNVVVLSGPMELRFYLSTH